MAIVSREYDFETGIKSIVHDVDDKITIQKTYDAAIYMDAAQAMQTKTEGDKWGEMRHIGIIPMAELATMMRQDGGYDTKRMQQWLVNNPKFVTFSKFLKGKI